MHTSIGRCTASALIIRSLPVAEGGTDTSRRVIKGQSVTLYGRSNDDAWLYVDAPSGRGWVAKQYIEAVPETIASPAWPKVPTGLDGIKAVFGEPGKPICSAGRIRLPAAIKLSWEDSSVTVIACHKLMEDVFTSVFNQLHSQGLWVAVQNYGGIYQERPIKGGRKISTHAWGISVDLDTKDNFQGSSSRTDMDPRIVRIFEDHGFLWGAAFRDPMHFQYAKGY